MEECFWVFVFLIEFSFRLYMIELRTGAEDLRLLRWRASRKPNMQFGCLMALYVPVIYNSRSQFSYKIAQFFQIILNAKVSFNGFQMDYAINVNCALKLRGSCNLVAVAG